VKFKILHSDYIREGRGTESQICFNKVGSLVRSTLVVCKKDRVNLKWLDSRNVI
jgi:hypothetical protein